MILLLKNEIANMRDWMENGAIIEGNTEPRFQFIRIPIKPVVIISLLTKQWYPCPSCSPLSFTNNQLEFFKFENILTTYFSKYMTRQYIRRTLILKFLENYSWIWKKIYCTQIQSDVLKWEYIVLNTRTENIKIKYRK